MKLTKEECLEAIKSIEQKTTDVEDYSSIPVSTCCYTDDELNLLEQLIKEYFENPQLTFDELKQMKGQPVWDACLNEWVIVSDVEDSIIGRFVDVITKDGSMDVIHYDEKVTKFYRKQVNENE